MKTDKLVFLFLPLMGILAFLAYKADTDRLSLLEKNEKLKKELNVFLNQKNDLNYSATELRNLLDAYILLLRDASKENKKIKDTIDIINLRRNLVKNIKKDSKEAEAVLEELKYPLESPKIMDISFSKDYDFLTKEERACKASFERRIMAECYQKNPTIKENIKLNKKIKTIDVGNRKVQKLLYVCDYYNAEVFFSKIGPVDMFLSCRKN